MSDRQECAAMREQLAEANAYVDDVKRVGTLRNKNKLLVEQQRMIRLLQAEVGKLRMVLMNSKAMPTPVLDRYRNCLVTIAGQDSGVPGSTAKADCMAVLAAQALRGPG
jgi:hypothetical protein